MKKIGCCLLFLYYVLLFTACGSNHLDSAVGSNSQFGYVENADDKAPEIIETTMPPTARDIRHGNQFSLSHYQEAC